MITTTIEQSKHLIELGLGSETADMFYLMYSGGKKPCNGDENLKHTYQDKCEQWYHLELYEDFFKDPRFKGTPAWSLSALLSVIPTINGKSYTITTDYEIKTITCEELTKIGFQSSELIIAVYEMICHLLEIRVICKH